ncbi:MAG: HEXXH motif-containing putative peptide modification protein [Deltaproteobacteria bacterium]|nr:HEXXH motif-containing putative peptide modification protein [Myxococcales bacterium]MDP3213528.1 HEXXH motif-containing putative peptide modification protein [Deltaproteobacteria bacterium]
MALPLPDITLPQPGSTTLRTVLGLRWSRLGRRLLDVAEHSGDPVGAVVAESLRAKLMAEPAAVVAVARRPSIAARLSSDRDRLLGALGDAAFDIAAAGWLARPVSLPRSTGGFGRRRSAALGVEFEFAPTMRELVIDDGVLRVDGATFSLRVPGPPPAGLVVREGWRRVTDRVSLALFDDNPSAQVGFHPERPENRVDLGGRSVEAWVEALREAFDLVDRYMPELTPERRLLAQSVVPVGADPERHFSCTYENAPGAMYLSLHPDPVKMAEAVVHEFQHDKLHAVLALDALLANGEAGGFRSPVRPDARPLRGVLLAAHAFLPVARMYAAMRRDDHPTTRHPRFAAREREVTTANAEAMDLLRAHARWTEGGEALRAELESLFADGA